MSLRQTKTRAGQSTDPNDRPLRTLHSARFLAAQAPTTRKNLFEYSFLHATVKDPLFPAGLRWINLLVLGALIYFAWGATDEALRYTNLGSWIVWVIWWPFVVGATLVAGRLWCTVCHLRVIADGFSAIGFKIEPPKWMQKYGTTVTLSMVLGLLVLHSSVISYDVHHIPHYTALYLVILIAYAVTVSLVFKKGSFCKLFCPLVAIFGPYSQLSPTELRSNNLGTCLRCDGTNGVKSCLQTCPNDMMMQMRYSNENCLLCFDCVKACPNDNIRFSLRGYLCDLWQNRRRSWAPTLAGIFILGIIFQELGEEWEVFEAITLAAPQWIANLGIPETIFGGYMWLETLSVNVLMPLMLVGAAGALSWCLVCRGSAMTYVKLYGVALLPLVFSTHFAKLIKTFNEKLGYAAHVFTDPFGYDTAMEIQAGTLTKPAPFFLSNEVMGWMLLVLVFCGLCASIYASFRISRSTYPDEPGTGALTVAPFMVLLTLCGAGFLMTIYNWLIL